MAVPTESFAAWLAQAQIAELRLSPEQHGLLQAVFRFRQAQGSDYYSSRLLSHFLLHCGCGLKVAQIARLLGIDRTTASRQQRSSSKEAIQQAHHRMDGRPYGKLLARYAGPIAAFLFAQPTASRADVLDFIDASWGVRVSRVALYHFLKKYGLDHVPTGDGPATAPLPAEPAAVPLPPLPPPHTVPEIPAGRPVPTPAPPFSPRARSTPAPSSSCRRR